MAGTQPWARAVSSRQIASVTLPLPLTSSRSGTASSALRKFSTFTWPLETCDSVSELTAVHELLRLTVSPLDKALTVLGDKARADGDAVLAAIERAAAPALIKALVKAGVDITEARWIGGDLETVFLSLTGETDAG